ncbi:hypothetical protein RIF29_38028 [Crotalaria pallida]|uniref:Uncharacterized protein n=1 Tax=Crotalaria pallida TaxID=3830 RepID=A0AAN9E0X6_CROPI
MKCLSLSKSDILKSGFPSFRVCDLCGSDCFSALNLSASDSPFGQISCSSFSPSSLLHLHSLFSLSLSLSLSPSLFMQQPIGPHISLILSSIS